MLRRYRELGIFLLPFVLTVSANALTTDGIPLTNTGVQSAILRAPLRFEENQGQGDSRVKYFARGSGYSLFFMSTEVVFVLRRATMDKSAIQGFLREPIGSKKKPQAFRSRDAQDQTVVRMKLLGARAAPEIIGLEALPGKVNYFIGNDPKKWRSNVPTYSKVAYEEVYPGIKLVYYGNPRQLEYDFIVAPGADPADIKIAFDGADKLEFDRQGDLIIKTPSGNLHLQKPLTYQIVNGSKKELSATYVLNPNSRAVGFQVASYDRTRDLIIDPVLVYSTYLGGSNEGDFGTGIAVDPSGNMYVTGFASSTNFPTENALQSTFSGLQDAFVSKFDASGSTLIYSTYLGGDRAQQGWGIAVDSVGNVYVAGSTESTDFPTVNPFQAHLNGSSDAFVAKLNPTGSALIYTTYFGGGSGEDGYAIALDTSGNAYITGRTFSNDLPTMNAAQPTFSGGEDVFVAKVNVDGSSISYSTYIGPGEGRGIAVDSLGNAYITGSAGANFPTLNALQATPGGGGDAFITKVNPTGSSVAYSTFLGGSGADGGFAIAVDSAGSAYVTGITQSANFPILNPLQANLKGLCDAFVTKLNSIGSALVYSTYLGGGRPDGSACDSGNSIAVDSFGNAYITGTASSTDFPTVNPIQSTLHGTFGTDAFVTKLAADGREFVYSTYLGGNFETFGMGIAVDSSGDAYVTGMTQSTDFPTVNPVQPTGGFFPDAFIVKIANAFSVTPNLLDFETVVVGSTKDLTFTIDNLGIVTLTGTATTTAPFSIVGDNSFNIAAGGTATITVRFSPISIGAFSATVNFTSNDGAVAPSVIGIGVLPPVLSISPPGLDFQVLPVGGTKDLTFIVQNTGGSILSGNANANSPFSVASGGSINLSEGQSQQVTVRFSPTSAGTFSATVGFTTNAGNSSPTVTGQAVSTPFVTDLFPSTGSPGKVVTISGFNFGSKGTVTFGKAKAKITSWTDIQIRANVPSLSPGDYSVTIIRGDKQASNPKTFTVPPPVLIVPGIYGSWSTQLFCNNKAAVTDFTNFLAQKGLGKVNFTSSWILDPILHSYDSLKAALLNNGSKIFDVPYDWRQGNSFSIKTLMMAIDNAKKQYKASKVDIVAHSMGGLVVRHYIQSSLYRGDIRKFVMLGTPNHGAVDAYYAWEGADLTGGGLQGWWFKVIANFGAPDVAGRLLQDMKQGCGFSSVLDIDFIRQTILSVEDLLPTFPFLSTSGIGAPRQLVCATNLFLEALNRNTTALTSKGINIAVFAGTGQDTPSGVKTGFPSSDCPEMWGDGTPLTPFDIVWADGDKTVLLSQIPIDGVAVTKTRESLHGDLPNDFRDDVVNYFNN